MNWQLAIEKNHQALQRIFAMLVAMAEITGGGDASRPGSRPDTLPRHLHRLVLRLLRPAEAATRRLIIVAARGVEVKLPAMRAPRPRPVAQPRTVLVLDRIDGRMVSVPVVLPEPAAVPKRTRKPAISFPLFDSLTRFGFRRRCPRPTTRPRIISFDGPLTSMFVESGPGVPPPPSIDDPVDARRLHRRLDAMGAALDDLHGQAKRLARWQARRDAVFAKQREARDVMAAQGETNEPARSQSLPQAQKRARFTRSSPMRPGRPPGWRRRANHDVYDVLNELHGLAVWARERRDSS